MYWSPSNEKGPQRKVKRGLDPSADGCKVKWPLHAYKAGENVSDGLGHSVVTVRVSEAVQVSDGELRTVMRRELVLNLSQHCYTLHKI